MVRRRRRSNWVGIRSRCGAATGRSLFYAPDHGLGGSDVRRERRWAPGYLSGAECGPDSGATNKLFFQQPDGHFRDVSAGSGLDISGFGMGVAAGDANNDGRPDLFVTEYGPRPAFSQQRESHLPRCHQARQELTVLSGPHRLLSSITIATAGSTWSWSTTSIMMPRAHAERGRRTGLLPAQGIPWHRFQAVSQPWANNSAKFSLKIPP